MIGPMLTAVTSPLSEKFSARVADGTVALMICVVSAVTTTSPAESTVEFSTIARTAAEVRCPISDPRIVSTTLNRTF